MTFETGTEGGERLRDLLERLGRSLHGKLVCDRESQILFRNETGRVLLQGGDGLVERNGRLSSVHDIDARTIKRAVAEVADDSVPHDRRYVAVTLNRGAESGFLEVLIEPIINTGAVGAPSSAERASAVLALVTIAARPHQVTMRQEVLRDLYRLTEAEARVVNGLVNGQALNEIADELNVSKNTIRSQLQSIFSKTQTRRQSELVNLILTGVAVDHPSRED